MSRLKAGAASADMTPPAGIPMAGGWRPKPSQGIDTPLMAHALVLDDGAMRLAIISLDLIVLLAEDANRAKERIRGETGIPPENIIVACSHTHEAPYPAPLLGEDTLPDAAYMARVRHAIVESCVRAANSMAPAEVGSGSAKVSGICANRRLLRGPTDAWNAWMLSREEADKLQPAGPVDEEVLLLAVRSP